MAKKMKKHTIKKLKSLVNSGVAIDVSGSVHRSIIHEHYTQIGYSGGVSGWTGKLLKGDTTNRLYVALDSSIFVF